MIVRRPWSATVATAAISAITWGVVARDLSLGLAIFAIAIVANTTLLDDPFAAKFERAYLFGVGMTLTQHLIGHMSHR